MSLLGLAILSLVISLLAGAAGFTGLAREARRVSHALFGIFLVIAAVLFGLVVLGIRLVT